MARVVELFISYPSDQRDLAERLRLALEAEGHSVFTDRAELREGEAYHEALRKAIADADAMVFLITPRAVSPGSYALTELDHAQRRWRVPGGHVLPVMIEPTPIAAIPPYLRSVTLLQPQGDPVAETVAAMARLRQRARRVWWVGAAALALIALGAGGWWLHDRLERQRADALRAAIDAEAGAATQLCRIGNHAVAWDQFAQIATRWPDDAPLRTAREDCGMRWLREMRVRADTENFSALVGKVQPVLAQGLSRATGERRADLQAHLGWADFLRSRDGGGAPDPVPQYRAALESDAGNVYAHAMWAHQLAWRSDRLDEVQSRFALALQSKREREWVRSLQFAAAFSRRRFNEYALVVANDMRKQGESVARPARQALWSYLFATSFLNPGERAGVLAALPPRELLQTFDALYPAPVEGGRPEVWRYTRAMLVMNAGEEAAGRRALEQLGRELAAAKDDSRVADAVRESLGKATASR